MKLLPGERPGECLSCGGVRYPVSNGRCTLCEAVWGKASAPEHIRDILPRVLGCAALWHNVPPGSKLDMPAESEQQADDASW
jgi:hypothetical protein